MNVQQSQRANFLSCLGATVVGAVTLGIACGTLLLMWLLLTTQIGNGVRPVDDLVFVASTGAQAGVIFGSLPGLAVLCFTRARYHPWRSLPRLLMGAIIGFTAFALPLFRLANERFGLFFVAILLGPTIGGFIASYTIPTVRNES